MNRIVRFVIGSAIAFSTPVLAQGVIVDAPAELRRTATPFDTTPTADFVGVSLPLTQDHLFESGWWFRPAGDTAEYAFPVPDTQSYVDWTSTITWNDVAGRGLFSAVETSEVYNHGGPSGSFLHRLVLTNLSASTPLGLTIAHMIDVDLDGSALDSAVLAQDHPLRIIQITDPSGNSAQYVVSDFAAPQYLVRPFGATDVGAVLSDTSLTQFDDTGLPFGPGDFTGGWMWTLTIPPAGSLFVRVSLVVNETAFCNFPVGGGIFCDGLETGDTSFWSSATP